MTDMSDTQPTGDDPGKLRERGDKAEQKAAEAEARAAELERQLALAEAGVPREGVGALFRKAYDGDLTPEAIKEAMGEYGIGDAGTVPAAAATPSPAEASAVATVMDSIGSQEPVVNPLASKTEERIKAMQGLKTQEELLDYLSSQGLVSETEASMQDTLMALPEDLRPQS